MKRLVVIFISLFTGCSSYQEIDATSVEPESLLSGETLFGKKLEAIELPTNNILAVDDSMRLFIKKYVKRKGSKSTRLKSLLDAMSSQGLMNLQYHSQETFSASETFHRRRGNCLSFTNLFIALAREIGLDAYYQQVDVPPIWSRDGDIVTLNRHINVVVTSGRKQDYIVDFNITDYQGNYNLERLEDRQAFSQFFNNIGTNYLDDNQYKYAFYYFKRALELDSEDVSVWNNLGVLYSKNEKYTRAREAYFQALLIDPGNFSASNNLAKQYSYFGEKEKEKHYKKITRRYRLSNPYYYFGLAKIAYKDNFYEKSSKYLMKAINRKGDEHMFYFLLAACQKKMGDNDKFLKYAKKALELSNSTERERYFSKLKLLSKI